MEQNSTGIELLEQELKEMEKLGLDSLPSLNHFLETKNLYVTREDVRTLRTLLKKKKYKLIRVYDYAIVKRGRRK